MAIKIINKTCYNLDIWLNLMGPIYWDNKVAPGGSSWHSPGYIWFTLKAKLNTTPEDEIGPGKAIIGNLLPLVGFIGGPGLGLIVMAGVEGAKANGTLNVSLWPDKVKSFIDDGKLVISPNAKLAIVEWTKIYGTDKTFYVEGGEMHFSDLSDGKIQLDSIDPLRLVHHSDDIE